MPGLGTRTAAATGSAVTPDRVLEVHFDVDENVLVAPPFSRRVYGDQIVQDPTQFADTMEVELLQSGWWIIRPLQGRLDKLHETTELGSVTMFLSEFDAISEVKQEPLYRTPTEATGLTTGAGGTLATSANDLFFQVRRSAGATWEVGLGAAPWPAPDLDSAHIVMDRVMVAKTMHDPNQGYLLRWQSAGTDRTTPDTLFTFYFGGPLFDAGFGQYCIAFKGNGECVLYEFHDGDWGRRMTWRYAGLHEVMNSAHTMRIFPHLGKYIQFDSETNQKSEPNLFKVNYIGPFGRPLDSPTAKLYTVNPTQTGQLVFGPNDWVTGGGYVAVDVRRDQRMAWQISTLQFPPTATLADSSFGVPCFADENALIKIRKDRRTVQRLRPSDPSDVLADVTITPVDYTTGSPLTGDETNGYSLPGEPNRIAVQFSFTTDDVRLTPFLRGFTAELIGSVTAKTIGAKTGGVVGDYQITGPSSDPTHETASLHIEDVTGALTSLRTRGGQNCRIRTTYDPADQTKKSTLFLGRVDRAEAKFWGYDRGQDYPDPSWRELAIELSGEWKRLQQQLMVGQFDFSQDETADEADVVGATPPPWNIHRIVEHLISYCGYQTNQIDVSAISSADVATRLPLDQGEDVYRPKPFMPVGDYVQRILRDFLGAYLVFCPNSVNGGFRGMWRVFLGPTIATGQTPLYNFVNEEPAAPSSGVTILGRTEAYPSNTTFIYRGTYVTYPVPPEGNALLVTTTGDLTPEQAQMGLVQCAINYRSYNPPGGPGLDDPDDETNVDYLGHFVPLIITDPLLAVGETSAERQAALDFFTRRLYNIACRGFRKLTWQSPLVLVANASDTLLDGKRPLRYGDFVRVDGVDCIIRSCNPSFQKDHLQEAYYEAEVYRAPD